MSAASERTPEEEGTAGRRRRARAGWGDEQPGPADAPKRLADGLDRVVATLGDTMGQPPAGGRPRLVGSGERSPTSGTSALFTRWEAWVGPGIAAHAWPVGVQRGELIVGTDDPAWASQLRWMAADLLERIAAEGGPQLNGLQVRVRPR